MDQIKFLKTLHNYGILPVLPEAQGKAGAVMDNEDRITLFAQGERLTLSVLHDLEEVLEADEGPCAFDGVLLGKLAGKGRWNLLPVGAPSTEEAAMMMKSLQVCALCHTGLYVPDSEEYERRCTQAHMLALGYEFAHVGMDHADADSARVDAGWLERTFHFRSADIGGSIMVQGPFELTKAKGAAPHGHIGIAVNSVARAIADLQGKGIGIKEDTLQYTPDGRAVSVYLQAEVAGFAIHLLQKR